jgi:hypothetical protein
METEFKELIGKKRKNLLGKKFGKLTPLSLVVDNKNNRSKWNCLCDCGNYIVIFATSLCKTENPTKSCGCLRKNTEFKKKEEGLSAFNQVYKSYRLNSKYRKLDFKINKEQFAKITKEDCYYCGEPPSIITKFICNGQYIYNGIDRVDNSKGYTIENCVPCCTDCNFLKGNFEQEKFLEQCKKISYKLNLLL